MAGSSFAARVRELERLKWQFGDPCITQRKTELLRSLLLHDAKTSDALVRAHDAALFLRAFPDNPGVHKAASDFLNGYRSAELVLDDDTGLVNTAINYEYNLNNARWLARNFPKAVSINWELYNQLGEDTLTPVLPALVPAHLNDALDDPDLSTVELLRTVSRKHPRGQIGWIIDALDSSILSNDARSFLFSQLKLPLRWELSGKGVSRTELMEAGTPAAYVTRPIVKWRGDLRETASQPFDNVCPVPVDRAQRLIFLFTAALCSRHRELYYVEHANPDDVLECTLDDGSSLLLFGLLPESRLPLEGCYSYLLLRSGVPIGYGGAAMLFGRAETATHIFEAFRGPASAFFFAQIIRVLHQMFLCDDFLIKAYQIGKDNDDAIQSGAFWFYYKLGFRPVEKKLAALAERESIRIARSAAHRSSEKTLRRLAESDIHFHLEQRTHKGSHGFSLGGAALRSAQLIGHDFRGDTAAAEEACALQVASHLRLRDVSSWTPSERMALRRLALPVATIKNLSSWPDTEKQKLRTLIRAKGAKSEAEYIRLCSDFDRLRTSLGG